MASQIVAAGVKLATVGAVALVANAQYGKEVLVQADPDNTEALFVGGAAAQPIQLNAGAAITIPVQRVDSIYVKSPTGAANANYLVIDG